MSVCLFAAAALVVSVHGFSCSNTPEHGGVCNSALRIGGTYTPKRVDEQSLVRDFAVHKGSSVDDVEIVLLGETHHTPHHERLQRDVITSFVRPGRGAVVLVEGDGEESYHKCAWYKEALNVTCGPWQDMSFHSQDDWNGFIKFGEACPHYEFDGLQYRGPLDNRKSAEQEELFVAQKVHINAAVCSCVHKRIVAGVALRDERMVAVISRWKDAPTNCERRVFVIAGHAHFNTRRSPQQFDVRRALDRKDAPYIILIPKVL